MLEIGDLIHWVVRLREKTHHGFVAFEHSCALGYAACEFYNLHFLLYFVSGGLLISFGTMMLLSLFNPGVVE